MDFKEHLNKYLNNDEIEALISSFSEEEKKAIYLNENIMSEKEFLTLFPHVKPHCVVPFGYIYQKNEYELGKKIYHDLGCYYIQEPSAMLVAHFLNANKNDIVLDLCAAPGGKTIQTALKMQNEGLLISNDLSKERANTLLSNIERLGISNTVVTSLVFSKQAHKFQNFFDKIILDAPCSGSGMFRKSEEMKNDWTYEKVLKNSKIQKDLILMCYSMLKEGGTMVYSTCSYSFEEDEEVIEHLLNNTNATLEKIPNFKGEYRSKKYPETVHLFPHLFEGEGHYIALIKKPGTLKENKFEKLTILRKESTKGGLPQVNVHQINHELPNKFEDLCLRPGLFLNTKINNKIIPSHQYSRCQNDLEKIDVNEEELIKYLKGESLTKNVKDGYYVIRYKKYNVGLIHVVNFVGKNLYPKGLRKNSLINELF